MGGTGNDSIYNDSGGVNSSIDGGAGADRIYNYAVSVSINGGTDNDYIYNYGMSAIIDGETGDDYIYSSGISSTINGGEGNDTIYNYGVNVSINGGADNDYIYNSGISSTIISDEGNDTIYNYAKNVLIDAGEGNDSITNAYSSYDSLANNVTLNGGAGNDTIYNGYGKNIVMNGGASNDSIYNGSYGTGATISGGTGADSITNYGANVLFQYTAGDGNDLITGFNSTSTLQILSGSISSAKSDGKDIFLTIGQDTVTLKNALNLGTLNVIDKDSNQMDYELAVEIMGTSSNDIIRNTISGATIQGLGGNDSIYNSSVSVWNSTTQKYETVKADEVTISGGDGNDTIYNYGVNVSINGGIDNDRIENYGMSAIIDGNIGNDTIYSYGVNVSINGGADNDYIYNSGLSSTINSGDGTDTIYNYGMSAIIDGNVGNDSIYNGTSGKNATINGGTGADSITNYGANVLFQYQSGDGNDLITGFNSTSTLQILSGSISSINSDGKAIFLTIGQDTITLKSAVDLETLTIVDKDFNRLDFDLKIEIFGTEGNDTIRNTVAGAIIQALDGNDSIYNSAKNVTINGDTGNDTITNIGVNVLINGGADNDSIINNGVSAIIDGGTGNDYISSTNSYISINGGAGNDTISTSSNSSNKLYIYGGAGNDYISNNAKNTTILGGEGTDSIYICSNATNDIIDGEAGNDSIYSNSSGTTIYGGDGNDSISNRGANAMIDAGAGNDSIVNAYSSYDSMGNNVTLNGGDGNDTIKNNYGKNVVMNGGASNDSIYNGSYGTNATISGGTGNDSITNYGSNVLFQYSAGDGNDLITGFNSTSTLQILSGGISSAKSDGKDIFLTIGQNTVTLKNALNLETLNVVDKDFNQIDFDLVVEIFGTEFNDTIRNTVAGAMIQALGGNDSIRNDSVSVWNSTMQLYETVTTDNVTIDGGEGNDTIRNDVGRNVLINGGAGNDSIYNMEAGANSTLLGGAGIDYIANYADNVTIKAGKGDDSIYNINDNDGIYGDGRNVLFVYDEGDGKDIIYGFNATSTLSISGGTYTYVKSDGNVIITNGEDSITLSGAASLDEFNFSDNITLGDDTDTDTDTDMDTDTDTDSDSDTDSDTDTDSKLITLTENDDSYSNSIYGATVQALGGDDNIHNYGFEVSIDGGTGKDYILNSSVANSVTINVDEGDDSVSNYGASAIIDGGAGNDYIFNYYSGANTSINGGAGKDYISNGGTSVTINGGEGNDTIINSGSNVLFLYTAGDGNDLITGFNSNSTLSISGDTYSTRTVDSNIIVTVGDGKISLIGAASLPSVKINAEEIIPDPVWSLNGTTATYGRYGSDPIITVSGVNSLDGISLSGTTVTISQASLNETDVTISDGYTLALAEDVPTPIDSESNWTLRGTNATYTKAGATAGYTLEDNQIIYSAASEAETFSISGVISTDGIVIDGNTIILTAENLGIETVIISDGYELALAEDVPTPETTEAGWTYSDNVATYRGERTSAGYVLEDNQIIYSAASGDDTLIEVTGVNSLDGISLNENIVTVSASSLNQSTVTITEGYELALGNDVQIPTTAEPIWSANSNGVTCRVSRTAGYTLVNNQINYMQAEEGATFAIRGVDYVDGGFELNGTTVTVNSSVLGGSIVTISEGYSLKLGIDVDKPIVTPGAWTYSNGKAIYAGETATAGYKLENNVISYVNAIEINDVEISGVKSSSGITIEDKVVTIAASALNKKKVTVNEGYTLEIAEDVPTPTKTKEGWTLDDTTATYSTASTTAGYTVAEDGESITYTKAVEGKTLVTVEGVKSTKGLWLDKAEKLVVVYTSALNETDITIDGEDYTLELAADIDKSATTSNWTISDDNHAKYQTSMTAGYALEDNKIIYTAPTESELVAELSGVDSDSTLANVVDGITLAADNFEEDIEVISSTTRKFKLNEGVYDKTFRATEKADKITIAGSHISVESGEGNDRITNNGTYVTINSGTGDDNVTLGSGGNTFVYAKNDGNDILYDFSEDDRIQISGTTSVEANLKNDDVVLKVDKGTITLRDAAITDTTITIVDAEGETLLANKYTSAGIITDGKIKLSSSLKKGYSQASDITEVDGTEVKAGIKIEGNTALKAEISTLTGGVGKDTLISKSNEFVLTGGKGNDLFVCGGGNDTITDYSQKGTYGADRISLSGDFGEENYKVDGNDVILTYSKDNSDQTLKLTGGKDKEITFVGSAPAVKIYKDSGILDGKKKSIKLSEEATEFDATDLKDYTKLVTIDGSAAEAIEIVGNKKANYIKASNNGSTTLNGGKGNDTLVGGNGADIFVYTSKSGNKVIKDYNIEDDLISLGGGAEISQVTTKGENVVLKVGSNKITLENAASFKFVENGDEETNVKIYDDKKLISADEKSVTLATDFEDTVFDLTTSAYGKYDNVSAELYKKAMTLIGDASDNSLNGGKGKDVLNGGEGNDTLWGGKGNDTLFGGDGFDTFEYHAGEGTDTIVDYNYDDGDLLRILDKHGNVLSDPIRGNGTYNGDDLTLSIKGGGKLLLQGVGKSVTLNINGKDRSF